MVGLILGGNGYYGFRGEKMMGIIGKDDGWL